MRNRALALAIGTAVATTAIGTAETAQALTVYKDRSLFEVAQYSLGGFTGNEFFSTADPNLPFTSNAGFTITGAPGGGKIRFVTDKLPPDDPTVDPKVPPEFKTQTF